MSDRDPGHRSRRSARFEIRPTLGRTALFNLVRSGGLLPPPRRCARNEKKDKRSLVEKEIDTGACLIDACSKGFASFGQRQGVTMLELFFSAKLLVDFALHVTSVVIERQGKTQASQAGPRLAEKSGHSKAMSESHPKEP